ncbi:MAG TPA: metal-dependent transcriptional regulator [Ktedonobacterales bacterium]|nr:metal-dependent transcriptional regulator [Ktedonobacterales bacterium]
MESERNAAPASATAMTATVEEYLETIYNIAMEGEPVIGARLAEKFRVAPPTVTETLKRMTRDGLVEMDSKRQVTLTPLGVERAEAVLRRHRLTERFLVDMLGMQWHQVHEEACRLEHYISGAVEERVLTALRQPTTCPHGNPIPGAVPNARTYLRDLGAVRLLTTTPGETYTIVCVSEVVEDEEGLISYLHDLGLTPGVQLTLAERPSLGATRESEAPVALLCEGRRLVTPARVAYALWVTPTA